MGLHNLSGDIFREKNRIYIFVYFLFHRVDKWTRYKFRYIKKMALGFFYQIL